MQPLDAIKEHAYFCALIEACTTADIAAQALSCTLDDARSVLKYAADSGYLRATLLPGLGNKIVYQPTAKAIHFSGRIVPKFLRAGLPEEARRRGLLRGFVRFSARPNQIFLATAEQTALCKKYGIAERGHARALVAYGGAHSYDIFVPILKPEKPIAAIEAACFRWLPLLEAGIAMLLFVAAPDTAAALGDALNALTPPPANTGGRAKLAALDASIAADKSGLAVLKNAALRAALVAEIEATGEGGTAEYPWLGEVVEAAL